MDSLVSKGFDTYFMEKVWFNKDAYRKNKKKGSRSNDLVVIRLLKVGECTKLKDILDTIVEWSQSLLIHKIEIIPRNPDLAKTSPNVLNMDAN